MDTTTLLAPLLADLKNQVEQSAFQLASAGMIDWALFNKVLHGQENRTLSSEQIDDMLDDLHAKRLLTAVEVNTWKERLHAAALTDKTISMVVARRNPAAPAE